MPESKPWTSAPIVRVNLWDERGPITCGCEAFHRELPTGVQMYRCPIHALAPEMVAELERLAEHFGWPGTHPICILLAKARGEVKG